VDVVPIVTIAAIAIVTIAATAVIVAIAAIAIVTFSCYFELPLYPNIFPVNCRLLVFCTKCLLMKMESSNGTPCENKLKIKSIKLRLPLTVHCQDI